MRSRIDAATAEAVARVITLTALVLLLWRSLVVTESEEAQTASSRELASALARWSTQPAPTSLHLDLSSVPVPVERDWIAALRRSGTRLSWSGDLPAIALEATSTAEPRSWHVLRVANVAGTTQVRDAAREIAALESTADIVSVRTSSLTEFAEAIARGATARVVSATPPRVRDAALLAAAGWEGKFVAAALEESGWTVATRLAAAPSVSVGTLLPGALDTSRFALAVLLDPAGAEWRDAVARFVASGGGAVLAGNTLSSRELVALVPARLTGARPAIDTGVVDLAAVGGVLLSPTANAVSLDQRSGSTMLVGARYGAGRLLASGYTNTWRWRMQGDERALQDHRDWWSSLAGAVAHASDIAFAASPESAPLAAWIDVAGHPAAPGRALVRGGRQPPWNALLFAIAAAALLLEIVSRRRRGLP